MPSRRGAGQRPGRIYVLAGVNGAGKTSIGGAMFADAGAEYFNPDAAAQRFLAAQPILSQTEANGAAWREGRLLLERAIHENLDFAFETTLGGRTMPALLSQAASRGLEVRVWYVGLEGEALHLERVRRRVAHGGHDIPEAKIRERYSRSRLNLIELLPALTELKVFDNTEEGDPAAGRVPAPKLLLHLRRGLVVSCGELAVVPNWAKPIVLAALRLAG